MVLELVCAMVAGATWLPPEEWSVERIALVGDSPTVTISREADDGGSISLPAGCQVKEAVVRERPLKAYFVGDSLGGPRWRNCRPGATIDCPGPQCPEVRDEPKEGR